MSAETAPQEETSTRINAPRDPESAPQAPPAGGTAAIADPGSTEGKKGRPTWLLPAIAVLAILGAIYGVHSYIVGLTHTSTDDAQVASRLASVAPRVGGTVTQVYVDDNEIVQKGKVLAEIDPATYATVLDQAKANLALAQAQEQQAEVNITLVGQQGTAGITQAQGGVGQNEAAVGASIADVGRAQAAQGTAQAQASAALANVKASQAAYAINVANVSKARDAVREARAFVTNAEAAVSSAQAAVVSARATEDRARKDDQRVQQLLKEGVVSAQAADATIAALHVATAQRQAAEENVRSAQAAVQQREAAISTAQSGVSAAQAQVVQANAMIQSSKVGVQAANESVRQAAAAVQSAQSGISQAKAKVQQAQGTLQQANTATTQLQISRVALQQAKAKVKQAQAALAEAQLNYGYTKVIAPIGGRVSRRTATVGQQVIAGTPLMQIVPTDSNDLWVTANFKETQLKGVEVGQPVEVEVDALGGTALKGRVDSLSPNTGAAVALLPPDNSTGNFTKVVQRVPVKITFEPGQATVQKLAVGMSVVATIDTAAKR